MIAFFDLDRTLLDVNSGSLWVRAELRNGYLSYWQFARAAFHLARYHLGRGDIEPIVRGAIATLSGQPEANLKARTEAFCAREVAHRVRPGSHAVLQAHRDAGDHCVLLTTSSNCLSAPLQRALGLDAILCNRFQVHDGRFTGAPIEPLCFGAGKVVHAKAYADALGIELKSCAFYTDSITDLPMLEAVGHPVAVHPDPQLKKWANHQGWPVMYWSAQ